MKLKQTVLGLMTITTLVGGAFSLLATTPVAALECTILPKEICEKSDNGNLEGSGTWLLLEFIIQIMTAMIGIVAVGMVAYAAFLYTTAQSDEGQLKKSKDMILNVAIGIALYALLWAFAQWLIPGGIFA